jgi:hypothetical protein
VIHASRVYSQTVIADQVSEAAIAELARKLTAYSWTLCSGFRLGSFVFLNDSFSEDGAQEYAVFEAAPNDDETNTQIESVTFGWMSDERARAFLMALYGLAPQPELPPGNVVTCTSVNELLGALNGQQERGISALARHIIKPHPQGSCSECA